MKAAILAVLLALAPITITKSFAQSQPNLPAMPPEVRTAPVVRPTEKGTYLGAAVIGATNALRAQLQIPRGMGVTVVNVLPGSPAAQAGIKNGDVLVKLDDQLLVNPAQMVVLVRNKAPGNQIQIAGFHEGKSTTFEVTLGAAMMPSIEEEAAMASHVGGRPGVIMGGQQYDSNVTGEMANASEVTFKDELYDITVKIDASAVPLKKNVTVRDVHTGQVVFQGNIDTPEQRAAVRAEYVERLKQMKMW